MFFDSLRFSDFLDNDDRMSSKRRNLSALVFLINLITKVNLIRIIIIIIIIIILLLLLLLLLYYIILYYIMSMSKYLYCSSFIDTSG